VCRTSITRRCRPTKVSTVRRSVRAIFRQRRTRNHAAQLGSARCSATTNLRPHGRTPAADRATTSELDAGQRPHCSPAERTYRGRMRRPPLSSTCNRTEPPGTRAAAMRCGLQRPLYVDEQSPDERTERGQCASTRPISSLHLLDLSRPQLAANPSPIGRWSPDTCGSGEVGAPKTKGVSRRQLLDDRTGGSHGAGHRLHLACSSAVAVSRSP